jgi:hypothetical protein
VLARPTPPARINALGEATGLTDGRAATLAATTDALGLFAETDGVVGPFKVFDRSLQLPRGTRALTAAARDGGGRPALVVYRLGRGLVMRAGTPEWSRELRTDPGVAAVTRKTWALLSR